MVKLRVGRHLAIVGAVLFVLFGAIGLTLLWSRRHTKTTTTQTAPADLAKQVSAAIEKTRQESVYNNLQDSRVKDLYKAYAAQDYAAVVSAAAELCPQLQGDDQLSCYNFYGQSYAAQKDYARYLKIGRAHV